MSWCPASASGLHEWVAVGEQPRSGGRLIITGQVCTACGRVEPKETKK